MGKLTKRRRRRRSSSRENKDVIVASIDSLPSELVGEVLARAAAFSFTDYFNAKLSCKVFYGAADNNCIFQQISLEKFPVVPWRISEEASAFLDRCKESGNPEALYRQGVVHYFSFMRVEYGLECLEKAASLGHSGALYVISIILLLSGDEFKQQGIEILSDIVKKSKVKRKLSECRENLRAIIRGIWITNPFILKQNRPTCCAMQDHQNRRKRGWESEEDDDIQCSACRCDREVAYVCEMFPHT